MTNYQDMNYTEAAEELKSLYDSLGVTCNISAPIGQVDGDWPHVAFTLIFQGNRAQFSTPYKMGVGLFEIPKRIYPNMTGNMENMLNSIRNKPHAQYKDKQLWADTIAEVARRTKQGPKPAEVLATCCADGIEAHEQSYEDWAGTFGYDTDSRKAEKIYSECREQYFKVIAIIGKDNAEKLAELARML